MRVVISIGMRVISGQIYLIDSMDEFMLEAYYRDEDRRLHEQALEAMDDGDDDDGDGDDDTLDEDPLETYKCYKEMGICD
jgi:hypothetical protein